MSYTYEDFYRDFITKDHLDRLTPEERLKGFSTDERLKGLSVSDLLKKILEQMTPEELESYLKSHHHEQDN